MTGHNDDDDTFVTIGTAFDVPEEEVSIKKPTKCEDQIVVDQQGRRRLHGAFTGGFSAGYFNTVGSKEGWAPSTFKSSRSERKEKSENSVLKPEDFMDEEDFADHGIAPRKLRTSNTFEATEQNLTLRKRQFQKLVNDGDIASSIPGGIPIDDLIMPANLSIGIRLLKKMGWKPGQGVGEKSALKNDTLIQTTKKTYGCTLPPEKNADVNMTMFIKMLAPKDIQPITFNSKDNTHGLGYSGINPSTALFSGGTLATRFKPTGRENKGITGQAFGVGIFEEEDKDIYGQDALSNYDLTMNAEEENESNYGWSGAPKKEKYKGCLAGFIKSQKVYKARKSVKMIEIPAGFTPRHYFTEDVTQKEKDVNKKLTSNERSLMLGEKVESLKDVNQWSLKWDRRSEEKTDQVSTDQIEESNDPSKSTSDETKKSRFNSRWDQQIHQERPKPTTTIPDEGRTTIPMYDASSGTFKPFAKIPEKQLRYEEFLKTRKQGRQPTFVYDRTVTEWERKRELDEFKRAAVLYRPLSTSISNRFTRASIVTSQIEEGAQIERETSSTPDDSKAAKLGMYGKLTRTVVEWYPDKVMCKRFNIPDPYPNSKRKGVPGRAKKTNTFFTDQFFDESSTLMEESKKEKDLSVIIKSQNGKKKSTSINFGPLSHLNEDHSKSLSITSTIEPKLKPVSNNKDSAKPTIDIFKAIFDESDSEDGTDSDDVDKIEHVIGTPSHSGVVSDTVNKLIDSDTTPISQHYHSNDSQPPLAMLNTDKTLHSVVSNVKKDSLCGSLDANSHDKRVSDKKHPNRTVYSENIDYQHENIKENITRRHQSKHLSDSEDNWEEDPVKSVKRTKAKKHKSKHKKLKKERDCEDKPKKNKKQKRKYKKKSYKSSDSDSSDKSDVDTPSNELLLNKLKKYSNSVKRPSAADFM